MNHFHVQYFVDAARLKSVAQSAKANFVTHPAVSQAIRTLEAELGVMLLTHQKRRFQLTREGLHFYTKAVDWLQSLQNMKAEMQTRAPELSGGFKLISSQSLTLHFIGPIIFKMRELHPKVTYRYEFGDAGTVREAVESGTHEIGLMIDDNKTENFNHHNVAGGHFILVGNKPKLSIWDRELIITSRQKIEVEQLFANLYTKYKRTPKVFLELVSWSVIRQFILKENMIGYVPDYVVAEDLKKKRLFRLTCVQKMPEYQIKAIWRKNAHLSPVAQEFLNLLKG